MLKINKRMWQLCMRAFYQKFSKVSALLCTMEMPCETLLGN